MSTIGHSATVEAQGASGTAQIAPTIPNAYPYDIDAFDETILAAGAGGPGNDVNLPDSALATTYAGRVIRVSNYFGGGLANVVPFAGDTINGVAAAFPLAAQYDVVDLKYVGGGDWLVIAVVP